MKRTHTTPAIPPLLMALCLIVMLAMTVSIGESSISGSHVLAFTHPYEEDTLQGNAAAERKPFFTKDSPRQYGRTRVIDIKHIKLDIGLDIPAKKLMGTAELTFSPINDGLTEFELDAVGMEIASVRMEESEVAREYDGKQLTITLPAPLKAADERIVRITYTATDAKGKNGGVNFIGPDKEDGTKPVEVWTQGEPETNRQWIPCFDSPCELQTSELSITVPASFTTLSNGRLAGVETLGADKRFHWMHDVPHVSYLIMFAAGEFVEIRDGWGEIPVTCFCHAGEEKLALNVVRITPKIIDYYSKLFGVPYPYAKYSQIFVHDFPWGGMENTSATVLSRRFLHDDRTHIDYSADLLVAHELAHQWFGDLLTCRDWSHIWLNEGFATYCECLWQEHAEGTAGYQYAVFERMETALHEDRNRYRRPLVCNRYELPFAMFDAHSYQKGSIVLHMLRQEIGDAAFFKAIKHYLDTRRGTAVVTTDFAKAIEEATGYCPDRFFDQWVYGAGQPRIQYEHTYNASSKTCELVVRQTQVDDGMTAPVFYCPIQIAFNNLMDNTDTIVEASLMRCTRDVIVTKREQRIVLPLDAAPDFVTLDVGNRVLKDLNLSKISDLELSLQLCHEPDIIARLRAAKELGTRTSTDASVALTNALAKDMQWQVRVEVTVALTKKNDESTRDALLAAMKDSHSKVRRVIMRALGDYAGDAKVADALIAAAELGDESCFVEAECIAALGKYRDERAKNVLRKILEDRDSHQEIIRIAALKGLAEYGESGDVAFIKEYAAPGKEVYLRAGALEALGAIARKADEVAREDARAVLEAALLEDRPEIVGGAARALQHIGDEKALAALLSKLNEAKNQRLKKQLSDIVEAMRAAKPRGDEAGRDSEK